jgi:hypothetical protein
MFGRRRHAAALAAARVPQLTEAQILELVATKIGEFVGAKGEWTVNRRTDEDTDSIFQDVLTRSMAVSITDVIVSAKKALESGEPLPSGAHAAAPEEPSIDIVEPTVLTWEPAPITVWTDLRKPVTGEIPQIRPLDHALVA